MYDTRTLAVPRPVLCVFCCALAWILGMARLGAAQTVDETGHPDSMLVYATDLEDHPELSARADQILVFGMNSNKNEGRFRLSAGTHRFCLEGGAGYFTAIVLLTDRGSTWPTTPFGAGCVKTKLPGGVVTVLLQHGNQQRPGPGVTASVRVDPPILDPASSATPLVDKDGSPVGGYWLMQDNKVTARGTYGLFMNFSEWLSPSSILTLRPNIDQSFFLQFPSAKNAAVYVYPGSQNRWQSNGYDGSSQDYILAAPAYYDGEPTPIQLRDDGDYRFVGNYVGANPTRTLQHTNDPSVQDPVEALLGQGDHFQVILRYFPDSSAIGDLHPGEIAFYDQCDYKGRAAVLVPLLGPGQTSPPFHLPSLTSAFFPMIGTFRSVRLGAGVGVYWGDSKNSLQGATISNNTCLSKSPEAELYVEPLTNVLIVANQFIKNASCIGCDFSNQTFPSGSNLSGWNLANANFTGSKFYNSDLVGANLNGATFNDSRIYNSDLTGASFNKAILYGTQISGSNLTNTSFTGAKILSSNLSAGSSSGPADFSGATFSSDYLSSTLNGSNFSNAQMCGVQVNGTDPIHPLDLSNASVHLTEECLRSGYTNLSYTSFSLASDFGSDWKTVNLTGATLLNAKGLVLSTQQKKLNLNQATLTGVNLQGVILDYANGLADKDLTSVNFDGVSLQHVDLHGAILYSADLINSNLDGASLEGALLTKRPGTDLTGAKLSGAFMRNVNLFQAQLGGASFAGASFFSTAPAAATPCAQVEGSVFTPCATAAHSTMNNTDFAGAYLYGADFSNSTVQGVRFDGAFLVGSRFQAATLSSSSAGVGTGFAAAFLQGANLNVASLPASISFQNAYLDFAPNGNILTFLLNGSYTDFPGFWDTRGVPVCVSVSYAATTIAADLPQTTDATTCPDGLTHKGGCAANGFTYWKSETSLPANYTYTAPATYAPNPPSTPACSPPDYRWTF